MGFRTLTEISEEKEGEREERMEERRGRRWGKTETPALLSRGGQKRGFTM